MRIQLLYMVVFGHSLIDQVLGGGFLEKKTTLTVAAPDCSVSYGFLNCALHANTIVVNLPRNSYTTILRLADGRNMYLHKHRAGSCFNTMCISSL